MQITKFWSHLSFLIALALVFTKQALAQPQAMGELRIGLTFEK